MSKETKLKYMTEDEFNKWFNYAWMMSGLNAKPLLDFTDEEWENFVTFLPDESLYEMHEYVFEDDWSDWYEGLKKAYKLELEKRVEKELLDAND